MTCKICRKRRPRRFCPGVRGDICPICCGTEREVTVECPLECEYLQDARKHEKPSALDPDQLPNKDVRVTEDFLGRQAELVTFAGRTLAEVTLGTPGAVDSDAREALEAMVRTYRTLESGLVYQSRPSNLVAARIQQYFEQALQQFQQQLRERLGMETIRNTDLLGVLVFFQRLEYADNNQRKHGRAFIDLLRKSFPPASSAGGPPLIVP